MKTAVVAVAAVVVISLYLHWNRYQIVSGGQASAYQLDRWTGQVWFIAGDDAIVVKKKIPEYH